MLIINFSHPITSAQSDQIQQIIGQVITTTYHHACHFDNGRPFSEQIIACLNGIPLTADQWQSEPILINPPAYAPATATLIAELHGRMGYFPTIIRIRPVSDSIPPQFEVAEIINLQMVREKARQKR